MQIVQILQLDQYISIVMLKTTGKITRLLPTTENIPEHALATVSVFVHRFLVAKLHDGKDTCGKLVGRELVENWTMDHPLRLLTL